MNIAVIFGGVSNENEISVITGTMVANVLKGAGYTVLPVYISQEGRYFCGAELADIEAFKGARYMRSAQAILAQGGIYALNKRGKFKKFTPVDCAVNCCHGGAQEGGAVCGLCASAKIPLASAQVFESAAFMDKYLTKLVLRSLGVKSAEFAYITSPQMLDSCGDMPGFPVIVKPVNLGSSIGVERADNAEELKRALECAFMYDSAALVEKYIDNRREINCACYYADGKICVSECEEAVSASDIFTYEEKYQGGAKSVFPADIPPDMSDLIKKIVEKVYGGLNMRGIVRFDFILSGGDVYLSEVNTVPGSLSYYLLSGGFRDFAGVLKKIIEQARKDFAEAGGKKLIRTGIPENISANACKSGRK